MGQAAAIERDWDLVASLAADLHDAHARLVDAVSSAIAEGSWQAGGIRSPEHWLVVRAGLSRSQASAVVTVARRTADLPATATALREGRLSLDQAAVVARHTPAAFDGTVAEFAQHATVPQLLRSVARYDFTLETDLLDDDGCVLPAARPSDRPCEPEPPASLTMGTDADGRFRLRYDAPAEVGALVRAALTEAKDHLFRIASGPDASPDDPRPVRWGDGLAPEGPATVTWADALVLLASRSLDAAGAETAGRRSRYRVQVHLDTDGGWLTGRPRLPRRVVEGLTCDGTLTPVWHTEGHPVNVGRSHRVVPQRTRTLVLDRDRGCRFPGCPTGVDGYLEVHHLVHWRDGGATDLDNLLCLCSFHHDGHHRGEFTVAGEPDRPDGLAFETRHGLPIGPEARPRGAPPPLAVVDGGATRPQPRLGRSYPAPTGGTLHLRLVDLTP